MKKKLLVLGVSGLTGYKIAKMGAQKFDLYGTYNVRPTNLSGCTISKLDLTEAKQITNLFSEIKPDIVINTTALHNVDFCEENKDEAFKVNFLATKSILENCEKHGSRFVHISTDYVFDGISSKPFTENDLPKPLSVYGQSKLEGEKILEKTNHVIIRPSVIYGWTPLELAGTVSSSGKPMNFAMWLLTKLNKNESLKIVTDQYATATLADSLAESILKIVKKYNSGLYHISGLSCESRFEFSKKLVKEFGYDENLIQPTDSSQFKQKAKRPSYSCLDSAKAIKEFDLNLLTTEDSLKIMKAQVEKEAPHLLSK